MARSNRVVRAPRAFIPLLLIAGVLASLSGAMAGSTGTAAPGSQCGASTACEATLDPDWIQVSGILRRKCLACHLVNESPIPFADHAALLAAKSCEGVSIIAPGKPENSLLVSKTFWEVTEVDDPATPWPAKPQMPPDDESQWLTPGQMELILRWIRKGAPQYSPEGKLGLTEMDFPSARECKGCHPKQFEEWSRSPHAYAQKSPVFEAFTLTMLERTSGTVGTFCTRCHTPHGIALGETGLIRNQHRSRLAMEGITCVVCHRRSHRHGRVSCQFAIEPGELMTTCLFGPFDDPVYTEAERHRAAGDPYIRSAMFCGSCHDVTNPEGLRLEEAFSEWRNGPAARKGITCHQCHMGPVPGVPTKPEDRPLGHAAVVPYADASQLKLRPLTNHSFCGPDYSLLADTEYPDKLDWMYEFDYSDPSKLTPYQQRTLAALRAHNNHLLAQASADRVILLRNAARVSVTAPRQVPAGTTTGIRVDVTSIFEGHNLPTGFTEERQVWVQVLVHDSEGQPVFQSGDLDSNRDLRYVHSYDVATGQMERDRWLMHFQSLFILSTERGTERAVVIPVQRDIQQVNIMRPSTVIAGAYGRPPVMRIQKSNLPPLAARSRTYKFCAPLKAGVCHYNVRLLYRHLPPHLLDKVGVSHLKPLLEVVTIDEDGGTIEVVRAKGASWLRR